MSSLLEGDSERRRWNSSSVETFQVVLSDPPWKYYGNPNKWAAAGKHYKCLGQDELIEVARPPLAKPGVLFMWSTSAMMAAAIALMGEWGLHYRGVAFVWVKTSKSGAPIGAQGVRPSITKPLTEFVLAATHSAKGRPLPLASESVCRTVFAPRREHSRKPDEVQDRIEALYPNATKLEMFSRQWRTGWGSHGNELPVISRKDPDRWQPSTSPEASPDQGRPLSPEPG